MTAKIVNPLTPRPQQPQFPRTLQAPATGAQPGQAGGPPLTAGTAYAPDSSLMPYYPNIPGGQTHAQYAGQIGQPPGPSLQNGQYNSAIYNGVLPDFAIENASQMMRRHVNSPQFAGVSPQQAGDLSTQFQDLMRAKTMAGDIDLRRSGAESQADLGLRRQMALADSSLAGGSLMARLGEGQMAASLPFRSLLLQLLG